ncbi:Trehalose/maltose import ATP-binding protein MalK [uncultured archaeon]|nr:Trehalose/maltose import ATP-binding protein MalK [uncultured archaeon]
MSDLLVVKDLRKVYETNDRQLELFKDLSFTMEDREFVSIIGPSGCGKSTLLRLIAGLDKPTSGSIVFQGQKVINENLGISMVFQSFGLFPWLNVIDNVAIGLEAKGMNKKDRYEIAKKYIEKVGLDGYEETYPSELSGGMKQRVGVARALAVTPTLLCMDEPFSALDALTAENLREEVLLLWEDKEFPPDSVLMVTHNVEEAVYMSTRILVLSEKPAKLIKDVKISLDRPRNKKSEEFQEYTDLIYSCLT